MKLPTVRFAAGIALTFALAAFLPGCSSSNSDETSSTSGGGTEAASTSPGTTATENAATPEAAVSQKGSTDGNAPKLPPISSVQ